MEWISDNTDICVIVVSREEAVIVYELFGGGAAEHLEDSEDYAKVLNILQVGNHKQALELFDSIAHRDPAACAHAQNLGKTDMGEWNGVWSLVEK